MGIGFRRFPVFFRGHSVRLFQCLAATDGHDCANDHGFHGHILGVKYVSEVSLHHPIQDGRAFDEVLATPLVELWLLGKNIADNVVIKLRNVRTKECFYMAK